MEEYKPFAFRDTYTPEEGVTAYYNLERTLSKIKNDCITGVGSSVTLTAPANKFVSTISIADANEQADAWLEANAQAYANNTGVCPMAFISSWKTDNTSEGSSSDNQVKLPLVASGTYNMVVEWGDGSTSTITDWNQLAATHTYATAGTYTIRINGTCTGWQFNNAGDKLKILNITKFGPLQLGNLGGYFYGCANLTLASVTDTLNLTSTTSLANAFRDCTTLSTAPYMNVWNIGNVTNMQGLFFGCLAFNEAILNWNTENVVDMSNMFNGAEVFNKDIGDHWITSKVKNMSCMFFGAKAFNQDIGDNWNTENVLDMSNMFNGAIAFTGDVGHWDVTNVKYMNGMFDGASAFNKDVGTTWNTENVLDMSYMFRNAVVFSKDLSNWDTTNVKYMQGMFNNARKFNKDVFTNTGNVENMSEMFKGAEIFSKHLRDWDTRKVKDMSNMFNGATAFHKDISSWDVSNVTNFTDFMASFTASYDLDSIYNVDTGWLARGVKPNITINFGGAQYYSEEAIAGRDALQNDYNWNITDGGIAI